MFARPAFPTKRRGFAVAVVFVLPAACTSMLGIDGEYAAKPSAATETASGGKETGTGGFRSLPGPTGGEGASRIVDWMTGSGGANGAGSAAALPDAALGPPPLSGDGGSPSDGTGGQQSGGTPGMGGHPASGGANSMGTGGGTGGTEPQEPDAAVTVCPVGTYTGEYRGTHKPSASISGLGSAVSGSLTLRFSATGSKTAVITGALLDPLTDTTGGVAGLISGTLDCTSGSGHATISNGEVTTVFPAVIVAGINGTLDIKVDSATAVNGSFSIQEIKDPSGTGSGTWSANH